MTQSESFSFLAGHDQQLVRLGALAEKFFADDANIDLDERETRRLIDGHLPAAGWEADTETLTFAAGARPQKGRTLAIAEWPTANGPADYVQFSGLTVLAVVEAKHRNTDVSASVSQALRYAEGYVVKGDEQLPGGPWGKARVPFLFATNGRPFLRQLASASGIWFRDARRPKNLRTPLDGWYTPTSRLEALRHDPESTRQQLEREPFTYNFPLRDYQERAIRAIEGAIAAGRRDILVAMAAGTGTGTGKTKICIALVYRLLKTKRFRRILFLVDRTALGEQAGNAFKETRMEHHQVFADIFAIAELKDAVPEAEAKVHIATVQAMVKRILYADDEPLPVDRYDCVVVDECHRGYLLDREMGCDELRFRDQRDYISKYRRVLDRFDAVRIGLTATPALHTVDIFGDPAFRYAYEEADGWLIDHDPPLCLHTELSDDGIAWAVGDAVDVLDTRSGRVGLVRLPDKVRFEVEDFNRRIITPDFNRVVAEWLAEHIDPALPGKTLIFCATDRHADIVVDQLKNAFVARYGAVEDDAVAKITGKADKPLQQVRLYKNEQLPKVAVTVDLMTTGIDVPEIVNLVLIRRVNSRILYEQMIGRATRPCADLFGSGDDKTAFRIFDAVGLYDAMQDLTEMRPVVANPAITFATLLDELAGASAAPEGAERAGWLRDQIVAKLQRKRRRLAGKAAERAHDLAGMEVGALEAIPALIDRYRQSILAAAFRGDLTADWRLSHPRGETSDEFLRRTGLSIDSVPDDEKLTSIPDSWNWGRLENIADVEGGLAKGKKRADAHSLELVPYLRVANVQRGWLDLEEIKEIEATADEIRSLLLRQNDILFNEGGDRDKLERSWVWSGEIDRCIHQNHVFRMRLKSPEFSPHLISHFSNTFGKIYLFGEAGKSVKFASIGMEKLRALPVPIIPPAEQEVIIARVRAAFQRVDGLEAAWRSSAERRSTLDQSILAKAFRGELVPQDPNDEPATVLLERIRAERTAAGGDRPRRGRRTAAWGAA